MNRKRKGFIYDQKVIDVVVAFGLVPGDKVVMGPDKKEDTPWDREHYGKVLTVTHLDNDSPFLAVARCDDHDPDNELLITRTNIVAWRRPVKKESK